MSESANATPLMVTYRPVGDDVDPRGEVSVRNVTRQVVHEVNDDGADLREIVQYEGTAADSPPTKLRLRTCLDCKG